MLLVLAGSVSATSLAAEGEEQSEISSRAYPRLRLLLDQITPEPGLERLFDRLDGALRDNDAETLGSLVARQIFWERDYGGGFDDKQSGLQNFMSALGFEDLSPDSPRWNARVRELAHLLDAPALGAHPDRPDVVCTGQRPAFREPATADRVFDEMGSDFYFDWVYVLERSPVFVAPDAQSAPISLVESEALLLRGWTFEDIPEWAHVQLPGGREGYLSTSAARSWLDERFCFGQAPSGQWQVVGYIGGGD